MSTTFAVQNVCDLVTAITSPDRFVRMGRYYRGLDPDILALVEVRTWSALRALASELRSVTPHWVCTPGKIGPAAGLVTFSKEKIELVGHVPFSTRPRDAGRGFAKAAQQWRTATMNGITAHPSCNPRFDWHGDHTFLRAQRWQIASLIRQINRINDDPLVVLGDINVPPGDCELYSGLINETGLTDPFDDEATYFAGGQGWRLDGIFYRGWGHPEAHTRVLRPGPIGSMRRMVWQDVASKWQHIAPEERVLTDHLGLMLTLGPTAI